MFKEVLSISAVLLINYEIKTLHQQQLNRDQSNLDRVNSLMKNLDVSSTIICGFLMMNEYR